MIKARHLLPVIAAPLLLLLVACGGNGGTPAPQQGDTNVASDRPAATQPPTGGGTTPAAQSDATFEDCPELTALLQAAASGGAFGLTQDLDDIEFTPEFFRRLADRSPSEIRADMRVVAEAYIEFFAILARHNIDFNNPGSFSPAQLGALSEAFEVFEKPELERAFDRVDAYFTRICG